MKPRQPEDNFIARNPVKGASEHFHFGSLSIFAIETLLALHGAELPSWWDVLQLS